MSKVEISPTAALVVEEVDAYKGRHPGRVAIATEMLDKIWIKAARNTNNKPLLRSLLAAKDTQKNKKLKYNYP